MDNKVLATEARKVIDKLARSEIGAYVDTTLSPPEPFRGSGKIRLIVVGQDPTVSAFAGFIEEDLWGAADGCLFGVYEEVHRVS